MRKLITALAASALLAAGAATGAAGIAQASTGHAATHAAALSQPGGGCGSCKI
jgi:hypothetical protein